MFMDYINSMYMSNEALFVFMNVSACRNIEAQNKLASILGLNLF